MYKNKYLLWVAAAGFVASAAVAIPVFAQTQLGMPTTAGVNPGMNGVHGGPRMAPGIFGTVTAISGDTITLSSRPFMRMPGATTTPSSAAPAPTIYTVDASNAQVFDNGTSSSISSIAVNNMISVQGTVTGTNVAATMIRVGGSMVRPGMRGFGRNSSSTNTSSPIQGNGEPVVGGNVTAISGTTLTVTNASNVTYTIDATSATIVKNGATSTIASVATGDSVIVQGTVNGTSVTASSIIDQGSGSNNGTSAGSLHTSGSPLGFLSTIGGFFKHLFGF